MRRHWIFIQLHDDCVYRIHRPDFPGLTNSGKNFEFAVRAASRELTNLAVGLLKAGQPQPPATELHQLRDTGELSTDLMLTVPVEPPDEEEMRVPAAS